MGKSEEASTFQRHQSGDFLTKFITDASANTQENIIMVDCVESKDLPMNVSVTGGDVEGTTRHMQPVTDVVVKATETAVKVTGVVDKEANMEASTDVVVRNKTTRSDDKPRQPVSELRNGNENAPQRSAPHDEASKGLEKTSNESVCPIDELTRPPLKSVHSVVNDATLQMSPPVQFIEQNTERRVTTDTGDTCDVSSSMTDAVSGQQTVATIVGVESNSMGRKLDETQDGSVDGSVIVSVTPQDNENVTTDSDAVSRCHTVAKSLSNQAVNCDSGDALLTSPHSSSDTTVSTLTCSVGVIKSPDDQRDAVSTCTRDIVDTTSDDVDMSLISDSLHAAQSNVSGDSVTHLVGAGDIDMSPNCHRDNTSMDCANRENVNTESVNSESVSAESVNIEVGSLNIVGDRTLNDKYHDHLAQNIPALSQSDTEDTVSSHVIETAIPLDTGDTGDVAVTHVITPICDNPVSSPALAATCADVLPAIAPVNGGTSETVTLNITPSSCRVTGADNTGSVATPTGNIPDDVVNGATAGATDQRAPDVVISSSKMTKRKYVGCEAIVVKRERLDPSYDTATSGGAGGGQVHTGVVEVEGRRGVGVRDAIQPVTVNPVRAPQLARHLLRDMAGKTRPGRPPVKTVTLRMMPPGGRGGATVSGGTTPRLAYRANSMWKNTGSKSDTCVMMAPSVSSVSVTALPLNAVACPYVLVSSANTSIVPSQFSQAQPTKLQTVTILPATAAPPRGRMRQVTVSCVTGAGGVHKALSRPDSVPIYRCPAPPPGLFDGDAPKTYTCSECLDTFWLERSLRHHLHRKSVSIRIHCTACRTALVFYNHCALLLHMRSHRPGSQDTVGLHRAKVTPLPQHLMPTVYWSVCSKDARPASSTAQTTESAAVVSRADVTPPQQQTSDDHVGKSPPPKTLFKCTECRVAYTSQGQLQHHLAVKVGQKLYDCDRCTMVMRNPCRYGAHVRVHLKQRPYVCPECGQLIPGDHGVFLKHVKWRCLHFTRTVRFTCAEHECTRHFDSTASYVNHIVAEHASNYYKCLSCPMAFRVNDAFEKHNASVHASTAASQHIIKCGYCDTVYHQHAELTAHMTKNHEAALCGLMHYVFKCPRCAYVRATKYDLIKHMETTHGFKYMLSMCNVCGQEMAGRLLDEHKSQCHPSTQHRNTDESFAWPCNQCSESFPSAARLLKHQRVHNGNRGRSTRVPTSHDDDKSCDEANDDTTCEYVEPTLEYNCSMCTHTFGEESELTRHLQAKHGIIRQFPCHLCGLMYESEADMKRHIAAVHEGKKVASQPTFTCWLCDDDDATRHFKKRRGLANHLTTVHRIPKNNIDLARLSASLSHSSGAEDATEAVSAVKRLKTDVDAKFVCAKCDFSSVERAAFVTHIAKHRMRDSPWQCHECALCFTARPSLRRHLFMVHRVRDFERYSRDAGVDLDAPLVDVKDEEEDDELVVGTFVRPVVPPPAPQVVSPSASASVSDNPLECTVCYKQFVDENARRVHMRTHGMAFIYSRRRATKPVQ